MSRSLMQSRRLEKPADTWMRPGVWQMVSGVTAIFIAVIVVYLPALRGDFVWDDDLLVATNPLLRTLSGLGEIWSGGRTPDYFPITNTVFWLEFQIFGQNPAGYHALSILLHAANALLVWAMLRRLSLSGAWLAALIFGIHPVHAESVAWISELKNVLSMFFTLLSMLCLLGIGEKWHRGSAARYILSLFLFLLALLSKTQVVFLPVVLLLYAWWRREKGGAGPDSNFGRHLIRILPFFLIAVVLGLVTIWFQDRGIGSEEIVLGSAVRRLVNAGMAVWWYAGKVFLPLRLMAVYPNWHFDSPQPTEWLPVTALAGLLAVLWHWRERGTRDAFFAFACFIVALMPVLGFLRMAYARSGTIVADHHQYFADVALIALFSGGIVSVRIWNKNAGKILTAGIVFLVWAMGVCTWGRAETYRNEEIFWQDNFSKNPDAWQGHTRLGQRFLKQEKYADAVRHLERAIQLKPELAENYNSLGLAYCRLERFEEGIAEYRKALALKLAKPATAKTNLVATIRTNLANALTITANNATEHEPAFSPQKPPASAEMAEAMRRYEEAVQEYEKALELEPEHPAIHRNLGFLLARLGRDDDAIVHLRKALELVPNEPLARDTLEEIESRRRLEK